MQKIRNIAVINLGYIGDIINASPVCTRLKEVYPEAQLSLITIKPSASIAKNISSIDNILIYDRRGEDKGLINLLKKGLSFRKYQFDLVIVLDNNLRSAILGYLTGAKYRAGRSGEGRSLILTHTIPHSLEEKDMQVHVTEHYMRVLKSIGLYTEDYKTELTVNTEDNEYINKLLETNNLQDKKLLGLCTCTRNIQKNWTPQEASKFINLINTQTDYTVVFVGDNSPETQEFSQELNTINNNFIDLHGQTSIGQLSALINKFEKFVSVDTGPMHMALALGVPSICLFFFDIYTKWGPKDLNINKIIYNGLHQPIKAEEVFNVLDY